MVFTKRIIVLLVVAVAIVSVMLINLRFTMYDITGYEENWQPAYHIQVIVQNSDEHFWKMFREGASEAGEKNNVYIEFVELSSRDIESSVLAVEQAIYAQVDGIAVQVADEAQTIAVLKEAVKNGLAVLTYENDLNNLPEVPTVGSNAYEIGVTAGMMAAEACVKAGNVAVILNNAAVSEDAYKNIKIQGIADVITQYPGMKLSEVYTLDSGMFEIEKLTNKILDDNPEVNIIICTDEQNTPGVAQVLVDANRVGALQIVGYGAMPQTLSYIERGVIYGTVCPNARQIGYGAVSQLFSILEGRNTTLTTNTDLYSVTAENVARYIQQPDGQ